MSRDLTFTEITDVQARAGVCAEFVMDEETFRAFYDRSARGVWLYLSRVTGDTQKADDLLQETFYRFLRADAAHDSEAHRRNSLYRIATNLARDSRRRTLSSPPAQVAGHDIETVASRDQTAATERNADFSRAMGKLKPRERAMLWLAYAEGASHREIADILGLKPASLKLLLSRARHKMAELLGHKGATDATR